MLCWRTGDCPVDCQTQIFFPLPALIECQQMTALPVTVLSGFAGVGRTTLLNHLLASRPNLKIAVIMNRSDSEESAADTAPHAQVVTSQEQLVELSSGCICCTLREDLLEEVATLAQDGTFDYLLI